MCCVILVTMQLRYVQTLLQSSEDGPAKITATAWSPNNVKLAVVNSDKVVTFFDENGEKQDKFSCKPADIAKVCLLSISKTLNIIFCIYSEYVLVRFIA